MPTQRPLVELVPDILRHIHKNQEFTQFQQKLYYILEGQLRDEVEMAVQREVLSPQALKRIKERIPPINILRKTADKLSKSYTEPPSRQLNRDRDQALLDDFRKWACVDSALHNAQLLLNAQNMFALEPFAHNGKPGLRALGGHQFLPYSDDPINPTEMTVFIKFMGREKDLFLTTFDNDGEIVDKKDTRTNEVYILTSDFEVLIIDSSGAVRPDLHQKMGISMENPFGRIPYVYGKRTTMELIPFPNKEGYDISLLVPKMLADLNFAAQYNCHSLMWTRNTKDLEGQEYNPDTWLDLGDGDSETGLPEVGILRPEADIDGQIKLIDYLLNRYFEGRGIKAQSGGAMANGRDASAIGKAVDEADTTTERKNQMEFFRKIEQELWPMIADVLRVWSIQGRVEDRRVFTKDAFKDLSVTYAEIRPVKTRRQLLEELKEMRALKMITRNQILKELRPEMSDEQRQEWIDELKDEEKEAMQAMLMGGPTPFLDRGTDGTFTEGNQAASTQDETSKTEENNDEKA